MSPAGTGNGTPAADGVREECYYCTVADVKLHFGAQWTSGVTYDTLVGDLIEEASRLIDRELGWRDCHCAARDATPTVRYYETESGYEKEIERCLDGAYYAANTITFTVLGSTITDTANGLAVFLTGDVIIISGSVSNDGIYGIATGGVAGTIVVVGALVGEVAGATVSITTLRVEVDETASGTYVTWVKGTDFIVWPYSEDWFTRLVVKATAAKVFPTGQQLLRVTGRWGGYRTPPATIKLAAAITASRWFKRGMQGFQDTGAVVEVGQLTYTKALDPDVKEMLRVTPVRVGYG